MKMTASPHFINALHFSPSFLWKEVPRRGGGWLSKRYFHTRGCQTRLTSLVCPFQRKGRE